MSRRHIPSGLDDEVKQLARVSVEVVPGDEIILHGGISETEVLGPNPKGQVHPQLCGNPSSVSVW